MNWRSYQNEIIFIIALILFWGTWVYKYSERTTQFNATHGKQLEYKELKRVIELQKVWGDPKIGKKIDTIKTYVAHDKVKWQKEHKRLKARFKRLNAYELNRVINGILNLPVIIKRLQVQKRGNLYEMECQCSW